MNRFTSFKLDICHTRCSVCLTDCFEHTFFIRDCGHAFCMICISQQFERVKKDPTSDCFLCINTPKVAPLSMEDFDYIIPHEPPPDHTKEASPPP